MTSKDLNGSMLDVARAKFRPAEQLAVQTADAGAVPACAAEDAGGHFRGGSGVTGFDAAERLRVLKALDAAIENGLGDAQAGRTKPMHVVFDCLQEHIEAGTGKIGVPPYGSL